MPLALSGELHADLTRAIASIAASSTFQTWTGAADAAEAAAYCYSYACDGSDTRFAVVYPASGHGRERVAIDAYNTTPAIVAHFEGAAPAAYTTDGDRARWIANLAFGVLTDMEALSGENGTYFDIRTAALVEGDPEVPDAQEGTQSVRCRLVLTGGAR